MQLPRGVTGFWHVHSPPPVPVDVRTFKTLGYSVGRVLEFRPAGVTPNFHLLVIRVGYSDDVGVICNSTLPLLAFVTLPLDSWLPTFIDRPDLAPSFHGFDVLTTAALSTPLSSCDLSMLTDVEHHHIRYWRPATAGEVIFNSWD
ncbi:hypothetical protein [Kutzneria buriramensis]|uniref:hypothetical protein n=1 Tax=Kutzneria buriramensis TaxID=1045776 RepID=UPI0011C1424B|nr:hypothetical protein [Kutzneria buriramensis]